MAPDQIDIVLIAQLLRVRRVVSDAPQSRDAPAFLIDREARFRRAHIAQVVAEFAKLRGCLDISPEEDECAGLDGLVTYRLWRELGFAPENTLHDLRWGQHYKRNGVNDYVWVFLISGAVPPEHNIDGYRGTTSERQPAMYFRLGGGTMKGVSKPGWIVWSRVFVSNGKLKFDTGLVEVVQLPQAETEERWRLTTPFCWGGVIPGCTRPMEQLIRFILCCRPTAPCAPSLC